MKMGLKKVFRSGVLVAGLMTLPLAVCAGNTTASSAEAPDLVGTAVPRLKSFPYKTENDGSEFDFLASRLWKVKAHKRVGRFQNSEKWEDFEGIEDSRGLPGNRGMVEHLTFPKARPGFELVIVRLFDPGTKTWAIYDAHNPHKKVEAPMFGSFHGGLGIFIGYDRIDGVDVVVRYIWTQDPVHPRFQQEFSNDGGKSWEIDWNMEFTEIKT